MGVPVRGCEHQPPAGCSDIPPHEALPTRGRLLRHIPAFTGSVLLFWPENKGEHLSTSGAAVTEML